jgi:hypothetical protein
MDHRNEWIAVLRETGGDYIRIIGPGYLSAPTRWTALKATNTATVAITETATYSASTIALAAIYSITHPLGGL